MSEVVRALEPVAGRNPSPPRKTDAPPEKGGQFFLGRFAADGRALRYQTLSFITQMPFLLGRRAAALLTRGRLVRRKARRKTVRKTPPGQENCGHMRNFFPRVLTDATPPLENVRPAARRNPARRTEIPAGRRQTHVLELGLRAWSRQE